MKNRQPIQVINIVGNVAEELRQTTARLTGKAREED